MSWVYRDRAQAGGVLADLLVADYAHRGDVTVLALPRGGVPVAYPIAQTLGAALDFLAVRKLGVPGHEELAMGAVAAGAVRVVNRDVMGRLGIDTATLEAVTEAARRDLAVLEERLRRRRAPAPVAGCQVVLVDDGLATGATMEAAIVACRRAGAAAIVVAVPVGSPESVDHLGSEADVVVCPLTPVDFRAVGLAYRDFAPVGDDEVVALLELTT